MLVIIHAKFEVNSCVVVGILNMHKRFHRHPMHNRVNTYSQSKFDQTGRKINVLYSPYKVLTLSYIWLNYLTRR